MSHEKKPDCQEDAAEAFRFCAGFNPEDIPAILEAMRENDRRNFEEMPIRIKSQKRKASERGEDIQQAP